MQDAESLPSRRGWRGLIALLILLLILLPLYLWPLRGGLRGLPGASALPGRCAIRGARPPWRRSRVTCGTPWWGTLSRRRRPLRRQNRPATDHDRLGRGHPWQRFRGSGSGPGGYPIRVTWPPRPSRAPSCWSTQISHCWVRPPWSVAAAGWGFVRTV